MLFRLNINQLDCQNIDRQGLRRKVQQQVDPPQQQRTPWTFWGGKTEVQIIIIITIITIIITRPKPAYGRQGLAGSWGQDTDEVRTFLVFLTSHFTPAALSSDLTNLGPLMTMEIHLETFKNQGNQPKTMKNHETTLKIMETKQKP